MPQPTEQFIWTLQWQTHGNCNGKPGTVRKEVWLVVLHCARCCTAQSTPQWTLLAVLWLAQLKPSDPRQQRLQNGWKAVSEVAGKLNGSAHCTDGLVGFGTALCTSRMKHCVPEWWNIVYQQDETLCTGRMKHCVPAGWNTNIIKNNMQ